MSEKVQVEMSDIGTLDSMSNAVLMNGRGSRYLMDIGDLDGDGLLKVQPGVSQVLGAPMLADYAAGTVTVSQNSKTVTGASTAFLANAFPGDLFVGPDGVYYTIESVESDTSLTLRTKYLGAAAAGASYSIKHRVWMMAPFYSAGGTTKKTVSQDYRSTTSGTFTNTEATAQGIGVVKDLQTLYGTPTNYVGITSSTYAPTYSAPTKLAEKFTVTENVSISGIWLAAWSILTSGTTIGIKLSIQTDTSGRPSGTIVTNANTSTAAMSALNTSAEKPNLFAFAGTVALVAGTTYWFVIEALSATSANTFVEFGYGARVATSNMLSSASREYYNGSWIPMRSVPSSNSLLFGIRRYETDGTKTYVSPVFDCGFIPTAAGTLTISSPTYPGDSPNGLSNGYMSDIFTSRWVTSDKSRPDTLTWALSCSASSDMSTPTVVATGQTALTYTITGAANLKRYYQLTFTLDSATGASTPLVAGADISFESTTNEAKEQSLFHIVGCGPNIYTQIKSGATTISTTAVPAGREVRPVAYQGKIIWTTGGQAPRYWDGVAAADAAVADMVKSDATAGTDPPVRAYGMMQHNDKLFVFGDVQLSYFSGTSSAQTATVLTDSTKTFTTAGTGLQRFRVLPDVTNYPLRFWTITSNNATTVTSAGADMTTVATAGDAYLIAKNYQKASWYTTEVEPADWPTANFLKFGDDDGDRIQAMASWKGRLLVVCRDQIWRVTGYGPSTPWEKELMAQTGGTLSPRSVVSSEESLYWWGTQGIVAYSGGYGGSEEISDRFRDLVVDGMNEALRDEITGAYYRGLCIWSFPSSTSGVNDRTIVFNPSTGRWALRSFGMYTPSVFINPETQEESLYFWDPKTGCICQYDESVVTLPSSAANMDARSAFITASNPAERSQWRHLRVVLKSDASVSVGVEYALDYDSDSYVSAGELAPIDSTVFGGNNSRTGVNSTDTIYRCDFGVDAKGSAISIKFVGAPADDLEIMLIELTADPVESQTHG